MKHYKSVKIFFRFSECQVPLRKFKPLFKTFWRRFWFLNFTSFHATVSLRSIVTSLKK